MNETQAALVVFASVYTAIMVTIINFKTKWRS